MKQKIYYGGIIITMEQDEFPEAVLVQGDIIKKVGTEQEIFAIAEENAEKVNLNGKTMLPSFIDAHSHFLACANSILQAQLTECVNHQDIIETLKKFVEKNKIAKGEWIRATGYDQNNLEEGKAPDKFVLDKIFPDNPVFIQHASGHVGVFNSRALDMLNVDENTPCPEGGVIEKDDDGNLTGYMEENAFLQFLKQVPMPDENDMMQAIIKAQDIYLSYGITTVQEGMFMDEMLPLYQEMINKNLLKLDVVAYVDPLNSNMIKETLRESCGGYKNNIKIGGDKIFLDGSPQGRTAWMRTAYKGNDDNYCGYPVLTDEQVYNFIYSACKDGRQILAHCNGDRAAQQYLEAIDKVEKKLGKQLNRPVMIHAQLLGVDQMPQVKKLSIIPSFFIAHIYHWGDAHIKNFGLERASQISAAGEALKENILFTFHQDSPVIEPNMLETIWCATNRITKSNKKLGQDLEIPVYEALKAVTINAAYQYFEEKIKGSIKVGKQANFVILSDNPLTVDKTAIKDIKVLQTIKNGEVLWSKDK